LAGIVRLGAGVAWKADGRAAVHTVCLALLNAVVPVATIAATRVFVDGVARGVSSPELIGVLAALAAALGLGKAIDIARVNAATALGARTSAFAAEQLLRKAARIDAGHLDDPSFFDRLERAVREVASRPEQLIFSLMNVVVCVGSIAGVVGVLALIHPAVAACAVASVLPGVYAQRRANAVMYEMRTSTTTVARRASYLQSLLVEVDSGIELRTVNGGDPVAARYTELSAQLVDRLVAANSRTARMHLAAGGASAVCILGALVLIARFAGQATSGAADAAALLAAVAMLTTYLALLANAITGLESHALFVADALSFLDTPSLVRAPERPEVIAVPLTEGIVFSSVTFRYRGSQQPALEDVSLSVRPGEMLAIVGANGAGKTSLIRLLLRQYDPEEGSVRIGGVDLQEADPMAVRELFGVLFQSFTRFNMPLREAVVMGRPADLGRTDVDGRVWDALEAADALKLARSLPQGLDSEVGRLFPGGRELSGGEWQKLALARLYYRDAPIWVLDEPTAALDPQAEAAVFGELRKHLVGRIGIVVSHRFSTVRVADHIAVLDRGTLSEHGSHEALLSLDGTYARLFREQAAAYLA
jgi:ATP-binding cassette subfamily B protein